MSVEDLDKKQKPISYNDLTDKPDIFPSDWDEVANKPSSFGLEVGDILKTHRSAPSGYLACDGSVYLQSAYPDLFNEVGYLGNPFIPFYLFSALSLGSNTAQSIAFNGSRFVMSGGVGNGPYFLKYSDDLITWTDCTVTGVTATIFKISYGGGYFFGVSRNRELIISTDGITWTIPSSLPTPPNLYKETARVEYLNGYQIMVSFDYLLKSSNNGTSWTAYTLGTDLYLGALCFGNGIWIAGGGNSGFSSRIYTSIDTIAWTSRSIATGGTNPERITTLAFGNNVFVCGCDAGSILTSTDGTTWTKRSSPFGYVYNIRFNSNNSTFYATGASNLIYSSSDGIIWVQVPNTPALTCYDLVFDDSFIYGFTFNGSILKYKYGVDYDGNTSFQVPNLDVNSFIKAEN